MDIQKSNYAILGLSPLVTDVDIHSAYRAEVRTYREASKDAGSDKAAAYKHMLAVTAAYEALNTTEKRVAYDDAYFPVRASATIEFLQIMIDLGMHLDGITKLEPAEVKIKEVRMADLSGLHSIGPDEIGLLMEKLATAIPEMTAAKSPDEVQDALSLITGKHIVDAMKAVKAEQSPDEATDASHSKSDEFKAAAADVRQPVAQGRPVPSPAELATKEAAMAQKQQQLTRLVDSLYADPTNPEYRRELAIEVGSGQFHGAWLAHFAEKNMEARRRDWSHADYRSRLDVIQFAINRNPELAAHVEKAIFYALVDDNPNSAPIAGQLLNVVISKNPKAFTLQEVDTYCRSSRMLVEHMEGIIAVRPDLTPALYQATLDMMYADPVNTDSENKPHRRLFDLALRHNIIDEAWLSALAVANDKNRSQSYQRNIQGRVTDLVTQTRLKIAGRPQFNLNGPNSGPDRHV